jgi:succinoglycan biosynthesis protein ExoM
MTAPSRQSPAIRIDICVCTFRRRELEDTIRSLGALNVPPRVEIAIIVADNDVAPSAQELVEGLAADIPCLLHYIHAPARNISTARNACLDHGSGDFLAFIDDDEVASPDWLIRLLETAADTGADAVLGPVKARYSEVAPDWMSAGDFHSTFPVWVKGEIRTGYTCNVLLRRAAPAVAGKRFNLALGQSGGEDTEYFARLHESGGKIAYAPEAWLYEPVPENRASFSWLAKRRFRVGQTHGRLLRGKHQRASLIPQLGLAAAKAGYCMAAAVGLLPIPRHRNRYVLRGIMHAGAVSGLLGVRELRQYGQIASVERRHNAA